MDNLKQSINDVIEQIDEATDLFYKQNNKLALEKFQNVISQIVIMVDSLFKYKEKDPVFNFDEKKMTDILTEAMNALQDIDLVLLADVMQYDFKEYLEELNKNIQN